MKHLIRWVALTLSLLLALSAPVAALADEIIAEAPIEVVETVSEPTPEPTAESTAVPTEEPTPVPTEEPTAIPTEEPTAIPTEEPTAIPTEEPTAVPTEEPTVVPTEEPTAVPTEDPTAVPTEEPTAVPTEDPTAVPTEDSTPVPTEEPTPAPTPEAPESLVVEDSLSAATVEPTGTEEPVVPAIDTNQSAAASPAFTSGYAMLLADAQAYGDAVTSFAALQVSKGVVYASERSTSAPDRLHVWFENAGALQDCWMDAAQLRPMSAEEVQAFAAANAAALYYENNASLPLAALSCQVITPDMLVDVREMTLGLGESRRIGVRFSDGQNHSVKFSSANSRYCSVSADGTVTSRRARTITITITSEFGDTATVKVIGKSAPRRVTMKPAKAQLCVGDAMSASATLNSGSASALSWSSSNSSIATVDANGRITAIAAGKVVITARCFNGKSGSMQLAVVPAPEGMSFPQADVLMGVGETRAITAAAVPVDVGSRSYSTDRSDLLRVDAATGSVTAIAPGTATLYATSYNGKTGSCTVTVKAAPSRITLSQNSITIGLGETVDLPEVQVGAPGEDCAGGYTLKSSNSKYVSIVNGKIKANRARTATITVSTYNGKTATLKVTVKSAPRKVYVNPTKAELCVGESMTAGVSFNSGAASSIQWSSGNPAVAAVDASGRITAIAAGEVKITARAFNGKTGSMTLAVRPAPENVYFGSTSMAMGVGEVRTISAGSSPYNCRSYTYSSSAPEIISVDAGGKLNAKLPGTATLYATSYNGKTGSCTVTVKAAPSRITLSQNSITIGLGETVDLPEVQVGAPGEDCAGGYTLKSSNSKYVSIVNGKIKANRARTATITVSTYNGKTATLKVTVKRAPSRITMNPGSVVLGVGESYTVTAKPNSNTAGTMRYSSSNEGVVTVDAATGRLQAVSAGSAVVTARCFNGKTAKCNVTVKPAPTGVALSASSLYLGAGEVYTLKYSLSAGSAGRCSFESDNPAVIRVDAATGKATAVAHGSATLRVRTYNGKTAECTATVKNAPSGIAFQENSLTIALGDSYQLLPPTILGDNAGASALVYSSATSRYVSVDANGVVKGLRAGKTVRITVKTYNGKSDTLNVTVKAAVKGISFGSGSHRLFVGGTYKPTLNTGGISCNYSLSSSNPAVAKIASDGKTIQALSGGTATITATTYNGKTAQMSLTVPHLPTSIQLQPASTVLGEGDSIALKAVMPSGQDSLLSYSSSDSSVVSVNESGTIRCLKAGSAVISVQTMNQLTSSCAVTVRKAPTDVQLTLASAKRSIEEKQLQLGIYFGAADQGGRYEITSSNPSVASVTSDGLVKFHSAGTVQITIRTYNGHSAACSLTVGEKPGKMYFEKGEYTIALGDTIRLDAQFDRGCESYSASIADTGIASASGDAVTGVSLGSTQLTASSYSGLTAGCRLNVVEAASGITLDHSALDIIIGGSSITKLNANVLPAGVGSYRFTSSDPAVATVDPLSGEITPVTSGDCVITVTTYNGHSAQCSLKVRGLLYGIKVGIDPGHQAKANRTQEAIAPGSRTKKDSVSSGAAGVSTRIPEHVTNLQIGLKLRDALEALGAEVYMTRESANVDISNQQRAKMMNELGVDVVLRIHLNSSSRSSRQGMSIYVRQSGTGKTESAAYAKLILQYMQAETGATNLGVKYSDSYTGLNWSTVPSMLLELGYLSNYAEDKLLNSSDYQDKLVKGMVNGICAYHGKPLPVDSAAGT